MRTWTKDQDDLMRENYPHKPMSELIQILDKSASAIYNRANTLGLAKTAEYLASPYACRLRRGDNVGAKSRFNKGNPPWNKGMKGWAAEGTEKTRFQKDQCQRTTGQLDQFALSKATRKSRWQKVSANGNSFTVLYGSDATDLSPKACA